MYQSLDTKSQYFICLFLFFEQIFVSTFTNKTKKKKNMAKIGTYTGKTSYERLRIDRPTQMLILEITKTIDENSTNIFDELKKLIGSLNIETGGKEEDIFNRLPLLNLMEDAAYEEGGIMMLREEITETETKWQLFLPMIVSDNANFALTEDEFFNLSMEGFAATDIITIRTYEVQARTRTVNTYSRILVQKNQTKVFNATNIDSILFLTDFINLDVTTEMVNEFPITNKYDVTDLELVNNMENDLTYKLQNGDSTSFQSSLYRKLNTSGASSYTITAGNTDFEAIHVSEKNI